MDFQAFIFCGKGLKLFPFSNTWNDNGMPKALLPVANRPVIEYVLDWCDQAQFGEINVVSDEGDIGLIKAGIEPFLKLREQCFETLSNNIMNAHTHYLKKPAVVNFIGSKYESTGEILQKELLGRIKGDFVLLPCDFVTNVPPQILLDQFLNIDDNSLAMCIYYDNKFENIDKKQIKKFFTVYTNNQDSIDQPVLLDIYSSDDVDKTKYLKIRTQMLWRFPKSTVSIKLLNSYVYFCSHELAYLLSEGTGANSADVNDNESEDERSIPQSTLIEQSYFKRENMIIKDPINCRKSLAKIFRDLARRSWQRSKARETVNIFILPDVGSFIRTNSLSAYMEANRYILKIKFSSTNQIASTTGTSSAIGADSLIGSNCIILEKTNIKRSVVGNNCKIGNRCKIVGSILLVGAEVEDEVTLENVIIGKYAKIGRKSKLTNCYVEGYHSVPLKTVLKGEVLTNIYSEHEKGFDDASSAVDSSDDTSEFNEDYDDENYEDDGLFER